MCSGGAWKVVVGKRWLECGLGEVVFGKWRWVSVGWEVVVGKWWLESGGWKVAVG